MRKVLLIDRDGTLITEPPDEQIDSLEKLEFYPGMITSLARIAASGEYELVMVTNQDGLGTDRFPEATFWPAHNKLLNTLKNEGIEFSEILIDKSFAHENKETRKPGIGLVKHYVNGSYNLSSSYVIGDRLTDIQLAVNMGCKAILINNGTLAAEVEARGLASATSFITDDWKEIANRLLCPPRTATVQRKTLETSVHIMVNLDGTGRAEIETGIPFFDHMLEQVARHGQVDLNIKTKGDLQVDEHHTIEDTGLALGEAFLKALGNKRGIERYGFLLPMDDCLAQVAIDFGGRPWLVWEASFHREKIGTMPTEMFFHFFKSFSDTARCNLNIRAEGTNEHHKIEAVFKAFAKALKQAASRNGTLLPTTKGIV
jgi:imidazoleglycerol-phosphate dehydratase/histidinol-phosphatase